MMKLGIGSLLGLGLVGGMFVAGSFLRTVLGLLTGTRPVRDTDFAHDAKEIAATPREMGVGGSVALCEPETLILLDVVSLTRKPLVRCHGDWRTWSVAGPNEHHLMAFSENDMMAKRHRLHVINIKTGEDKILFERPGDALWERSIAASMAVAGKADIAIIAVGTGNLQLHTPEAYMTVCDLEKVDLSSGTIKRFKVDALEGELAVSPDGRYVFYIAAANRELATWLRSRAGERPSASATDLTPVVYRLDTSTSGTEPIYPGWNVVSGPRDGTLAIADYDGRSTVYDQAKGTATPLALPNYISGVLGFAHDGIVICSAQQIRKEDVQFTRYHGLPGPRPMPRIVAYDSKTNRVATLVKAYDFRDRTSYGLGSE